MQRLRIDQDIRSMSEFRTGIASFLKQVHDTKRPLIITEHGKGNDLKESFQIKIVWSPLAIDRATEIAEYISLDNPTAAQGSIDTIFKQVGVLKSSPERGRIVPEISRKDIREIILGNYRIIYRNGKNVFLFLQSAMVIKYMIKYYL